MAVVLDSVAIVGFLDGGDALHDAVDRAIRRLLPEEPLLASVVTFAEVLTGARLDHHDEDLVRGFFDDLVHEILPVDVAIAERAAELRSRRRSLRMPDALILASAEAHPDADVLVTGDADLGSLRRLRCRVSVLR